MRAIIDGFMHIMHCSVGSDICMLAGQRLGSLRISRQILTSKRKPIFIITRWRLRGMQRGVAILLSCCSSMRPPTTMFRRERESSAIGRPAMTSEVVNKNEGRIQMSWKGNNLQRIWLNSLLSTPLHSTSLLAEKMRTLSGNRYDWYLGDTVLQFECFFLCLKGAVNASTLIDCIFEGNNLWSTDKYDMEWRSKLGENPLEWMEFDCWNNWLPFSGCPRLRYFFSPSGRWLHAMCTVQICGSAWIPHDIDSNKNIYICEYAQGYRKPLTGSQCKFPCDLLINYCSKCLALGFGYSKQNLVVLIIKLENDNYIFNVFVNLIIAILLLSNYMF